MGRKARRPRAWTVRITSQPTKQNTPRTGGVTRTGATGLEPATSGVTEPSGLPYLALVSQSWWA